jgi:aspartate-semialdehyde dehydrogenase
MSRIKVGVLGAAGTVGQRFVQLLADHPWFEVTALAGSERTQGQTYADAVQWHLGEDPPAYARKMTLQASEPGIDCEIVFSALPGEIAGPMETHFAASGYKVFTNAGAHRMDIDVPLVVPYLNPDHLAAIPAQQMRHRWSGFILSNPNCASIPLAMALAPLCERFGVPRVFVTTLQAISGAGYPGVPSYDILGDVVPYIGGEEQKLETEPLKILGTWNGVSFEQATIQISAQCHRVPVREGHLLAIAAELGTRVTADEILATWREWRPAAIEMGLPSAPKEPLVYRTEPDRPRPGKDALASGGMGAVLGRLRPCPLLGWKFSALGHNTVLGAAGCSLLNAELYVASEQV